MDDEDLDTLFAVRLSKERSEFWRQISQLIVIVVAMCVGFGMFGAMQYLACKSRDPNVGLMECLSGAANRGKRK